MDFLNSIIDTYNIPLLSAFLLGIITSISPCPLATNITAIAYISKQLHSVKQTIIHSLFYALGRIFSYSVIVLLIKIGFSSFDVANLFQGWGDKVLGFVLFFIGAVMLNLVKLPSIFKGSSKIDSIKEKLNKKGYLGTFLLGALFALAFCPYSGVMFFGILIPMILVSDIGLGLSLVYGFGTALPVIIFTLLFVISVKQMSKVFGIVGKIEKYLRHFIAITFIIIGFYYIYRTINSLFLIF